MGIFLKIEGEFLTIVSGIDSKYLVAVMTAILLLELLYTVLGGMVSVVITDFIQYVLLSVATILVSLYAVFHAGWGNISGKSNDYYGKRGLQSFHELAIRLDVFDLAGAAVAWCAYLLANDCDAGVFY